MAEILTSDTVTTIPNTERVIVSTADKVNVVDPSSMIINMFGYHVNIGTMLITFIIMAVIFFIWKTSKDTPLNFSDMVTADGKKVSLTKFLQLLGGLASTWFVLRLGLDNKLSEGMFGIYLTYIASVEGFAKFMAAKYGYSETSVAEAHSSESKTGEALREVAMSAAEAENSAREAKTTALSVAANQGN